MNELDKWMLACEKINAGYTPGGKKALTVASGIAIVAWLKDDGILVDGLRILDIGSGNGRFPIGLCCAHVPVVHYAGLEIIRPSVEFCQDAFRNRHEFEFFHSDVRNDHYWPKGRMEAIDYKLPFAAGKFDLVVAMSFFSHTGKVEVAAHYLAEIARVMDDDGNLLSTWYVADDQCLPSDDEAKSAYRMQDIEQAALAANLGYTRLDTGAHDLAGQTALVMKKVNL